MSLAYQGRGLFIDVLGGLGVFGCRALGSSGSALRVCHSFSLSPSALSNADSPPELYPIVHPRYGSCGCSEGFIFQGCHRTRFIWSELLQSPFRNAKDHWWLASGYRFIIPQPVRAPVPFSYGDGAVCSPIWRLAHFSPPLGHIPPSSSSPSVSEVFALLSRFPGVSISGSMLWFIISASCLHVCHGPGLLHHASFYRILRYLDDWLVLGSSLSEIMRARDFLLLLCADLGIQVKLAKSSFQPAQRLDYLRMTLQSTPLRAFPTQARIHKILCLVDEFASSPEQPLSLWRSLLGVMSSLSTIIPGSRLRMRSLQHRLLVSRPGESPTTLVSWDTSCQRDLRW